MQIKSKNNTDEYRSIDITEQYLIVCPRNGRSSEILPYSDIEELEVILAADEYYHKGSAYTTLQDMFLSVSTFKGTTITLTSKCSYNKLFELIEYKNKFKSFKLYAQGPKDAIDIPIKLYSRFGINLPIKDSDRVITMELLAGTFVFLPLFCEIPVIPTNMLDFSFIMFFEILALITSSICLYQEYLKIKIRKLLNI